MFKRVSFLLLAVSLVLGSQLFLGCELEDDAEPGLAGYWKSPPPASDGFEIAGTSYKQYDDAAKTVSFAGTIVNSPNLDAASGFITMKITDAGTWFMTVDKYHVVRWKSLSGTGVQGSSAYKAGGINGGMDTRAEAEAEYTEANGYFAYYGDYVKQP
jgi:hypothetical protein